MKLFRKKQQSDPIEDELEDARQDALDKLTASLDAAQAASQALEGGAPADCPEVGAAREAIREANAAITRWRELGGMDRL